MAKPAYEKLYEQLREKILSGSYPFGSRLPGKRALAEQSGLSVITVAHSLEMLSEEGYISPRERSGCYVSYNISDTYAGSSPETGTPVPSDQRSSADMDGFPFPVLARTLRRVLAEQGEALMKKSPNQGILSFRTELSRYLERSREIQAAPEQIIIGAGAEYLYGLLVDLLGTEKSWAIESPSYEKIEQVYTARGVSLVRLPLSRDGISTSALQKSEASFLHVSPYRSYPSDVTASASKRAEYLRWGNVPGRIIIEDDYESEFSIMRKPMPPLYSRAVRENVIYINTFSRTISPAVRVGYMVLPVSLVPLYSERAGFYSCTVPALEQYLLSELIRSGDFERHIRRVRRKLRASLIP